MQELARRSKVSKDTIRRFESGEAVLPRTVDSLRVAMEGAGVEFLAAGTPTAGIELHLPDGMIVRKRRGDGGGDEGGTGAVARRRG